MTAKQIRAELTEEELQIVNLSLPQMTGGMKQLVEHLAIERIKTKKLVEALEKIRIECKLYCEHYSENPVVLIPFVRIDEYAAKALTDAGE